MMRISFADARKVMRKMFPTLNAVELNQNVSCFFDDCYDHKEAFVSMESFEKYINDLIKQAG